MKRLKISAVSAVVSVCAVLLLLTAGNVAAAKKMPAFSLSDAVTGSIVNSSEFAGKTLLVTFFATWCPPCMQEIPSLIDLQEAYGAKGFSVVGLSVDQSGVKVVKRLIERRSINYPVLMAEGSTARDFGGVVGIPTSFLVNSKGVVVKKYPGYVPHAVLENDIKKIMN